MHVVLARGIYYERNDNNIYTLDEYRVDLSLINT